MFLPLAPPAMPPSSSAAHGGSMSGEHGDGLVLSELFLAVNGLDLQAALALFERVKDVFDPQRLLNPAGSSNPTPPTPPSGWRRPGG